MDIITYHYSNKLLKNKLCEHLHKCILLNNQYTTQFYQTILWYQFHFLIHLCTCLCVCVCACVYVWADLCKLKQSTVYWIITRFLIFLNHHPSHHITSLIVFTEVGIFFEGTVFHFSFLWFYSFLFCSDDCYLTYTFTYEDIR